MTWYNPKEANLCLPEGEYDAAVTRIEEHVGKESGVVGRKLTLVVYHGDGKKMTMTDYLMSGPKSTWKIKEFAKAIGQVDAFNAGEFDPMDHAGVNFRVSLVIEDNYQYGEQNKIGRYLPRAPGGTAAAKPPAAPTAPKQAKPVHTPIGDEDIPF